MPASRFGLSNPVEVDAGANTPLPGSGICRAVVEVAACYYEFFRGRMVAGGELRHLAGSPGGGVDMGSVVLKVE